MSRIKACYLLAILCVVKASVVINVYDENDLDQASSSQESLQGCDNNACYQLCRRLRFPSGICVNGRCKCDNFVDADAVATADDAIGGIKLDTLLETYASEGTCKDKQCQDICHKLGFRIGVCVDGRCTCSNYGSIAIGSSDKQIVPPFELEYNSLSDCNNLECDQSCRRIGFTGGVCVNGRCKCDINRIKKCNDLKCDQRCRGIHFTGGVCVNGRCKCDINQRNKHILQSSDKFEVKDEDSSFTLKTRDGDHIVLPTKLSCDIFACDDMCHRLNYTGGSCMSGQCECF